MVFRPILIVSLLLFPPSRHVYPSGRSAASLTLAHILPGKVQKHQPSAIGDLEPSPKVGDSGIIWNDILRRSASPVSATDDSRQPRDAANQGPNSILAHDSGRRQSNIVSQSLQSGVVPQIPPGQARILEVEHANEHLQRGILAMNPEQKESNHPHGTAASSQVINLSGATVEESVKPPPPKGVRGRPRKQTESPKRSQTSGPTAGVSKKKLPRTATTKYHMKLRPQTSKRAAGGSKKKSPGAPTTNYHMKLRLRTKTAS